MLAFDTFDIISNVLVAVTLTLIRRFNHHSAIVLGSKALAAAAAAPPAAPAAKSASKPSAAITRAHATDHAHAHHHHSHAVEKLREEITLHDLEAPSAANGVPLQIQDQRRYFEGHSTQSDQMVTDSSVDVRRALAAYQKQLDGMKAMQPRANITDATASAIMHELGKSTSSHLDLSADQEVRLHVRVVCTLIYIHI